MTAQKAGPWRWKMAGWLYPRLPDVRGRDRLVRVLKGPPHQLSSVSGALTNGVRFDLAAGHDGSVQDLIALQYRRPALADIVDYFSEPGATVYDVGANIGVYTMWAAQSVGITGQVHAFEPIPGTALLLRELVRLNRMSQVTIIQSAAGCQQGNAVMFYNPNASGLASMSPSEAAVPINVDVLTLDSYANTHRPPALIKVDVEGSEAEVLRGASRLLLEHRPALLLEVIDRVSHSASARSVLPIVRQAGYTVFDLTRSGLRPSGWPTSSNVLALNLSTDQHRRAYEALRSVAYPRNQTT